MYKYLEHNVEPIMHKNLHEHFRCIININIIHKLKHAILFDMYHAS